ncbi:hypothetical protein CCACVL1_01584 [Corchorus capsularis]|uniref:Uncharacterized protein n=1 Tax=Corchorus capsularis TaxID=210143 RepID=A0A1R3KH57_COCAP|nr:hypothetical protein CCACVL1_01584 [Corchorus capsularis]
MVNDPDNIHRILLACLCASICLDIFSDGSTVVDVWAPHPSHDLTSIP